MTNQKASWAIDAKDSTRIMADRSILYSTVAIVPLGVAAISGVAENNDLGKEGTRACELEEGAPNVLPPSLPSPLLPPLR